ncbi:gamma-glutamyl phosphate reductase [Microcystis aeruginosa NIES-2520]|jgi:glutamate-5-semialdehyde dehydrogenase|uniref:Gamma-glutamyl phosphate reductase n=1 Tax=Microcystis aeruginosa NIES-2520 TaxID=2303982 RepID=A0A5A5RQS7_MICAE|nr:MULTISPECIES: glutamate-5-semialdehyde dehydrogenase [Microcystis]NCR74499.1 glutamate-5-semialdehyde dehydrogenase [Microcystis aeruginosa K13-06]MCA2665564.1 glutamate-5-semialdehyde dehydrogenase [Microcystis sp. M045S2]MCA2714646.1 glutamate-5-semialdehyde dehydrogenase [Microcystis sp. M172S2]MCA2802874.1 glutamate-5-semialdehyde dehydrogenase [Microcystis sp. M114S2]MCA2833833.1 glutamate-5-semialdehyde dehydrogenase [Microcystis sp. M007S1]
MVTTSLSLPEIARETRQASRQLAILTNEERNEALEAIADALTANADKILEANIADVQTAKAMQLSQALCARLELSPSKLKAAIAGVRDVAKLADPLATMQINRELDQGLILRRITCPLGVLGVIFEARPDALIQITSLAIKSGNGVILKGGKEALRSCQALVIIIHQALSQTKVNPAAVRLLTTREEIQELLKLDQYIDLIIPRGSNEFVRYIQNNTRIPVLGHADGICHLYIDKEADLSKAIRITVDGKTQYPAACNAIETLLVHQDIARQFLPAVAQALEEKKVKLLGDEATCQIINVPSATEQDWQTEYSDLILSIKIVDSLESAIEHINYYGSRHTEGIVSENLNTAKTFSDRVDAAGVFHNCSTRFADGFRYGFGAEVGISTQKMPPRGPVGLEGLVTYKYQLVGDGHIVADYSGENAQSFTHKDL